MEEKARKDLIQKVIDRLVAPSGSAFAAQLEELIDFYPDNERPLDNKADNLITMSGEVINRTLF